MSNLESPQEGTLPKIIQMVTSPHYLFALDENGKMWILNHYMTNNDDDLLISFDGKRFGWILLPPKTLEDA